MRYLMLTIYIVAALLVVGGCCWYVQTSTLGISLFSTAADANGRVLGVSEAVAGGSADGSVQSADNSAQNSAGLPENIDIATPTPVLRLEADEYSLNAFSGAVYDEQSQTWLYDDNGDEPTQIASITKLATALVFLEHNPGWDTVYRIKPDDVIEGGRIYLYTGDEVTVNDLFHLSLVASANSATEALVHATGMTESEFVDLMNKKVKELGLTRTHFDDPIGLSTGNVSTAKEVTRLASIALRVPVISDATLSKSYRFTTARGRRGEVYSTDSLLDVFPKNGIESLGGKTGFTDAAGYCFVGRFTDPSGHTIVSAIMGGPDYNSRFSETKGLIEWVYGNFDWP